METEELIEISEAAAIIGVSPAQVSRYCARGLLSSVPGQKRGRGYVRKIRRVDAESFQRPKHGPKSKAVGVVALALLLLLLPRLALAQDFTPPDAPVLANPTDLSAVLIWLAGGGAGMFVAVWIEKQRWFQQIAGQYKPMVVMTGIIIVALIPRLLLDFVPANVWEVIQPYFATVVTAILVGYPLSQVFHEWVNRQAADRKANLAALEEQTIELERQFHILE